MFVARRGQVQGAHVHPTGSAADDGSLLRVQLTLTALFHTVFWPVEDNSAISAIGSVAFAPQDTSEPTGESTRFLRIITSGYSRPAGPPREDDLDEFDWPVEAPGIVDTLVTRAIAVIGTLAARLGVSSRVSRTRLPAKLPPTAPVARQPTPSALALRHSPSTTIVLRSVRAAQVAIERHDENADRVWNRSLREDVEFRREMELIRESFRRRELQLELELIARIPHSSSHRPALECVARTTSMHQSCRRLSRAFRLIPAVCE